MVYKQSEYMWNCQITRNTTDILIIYLIRITPHAGEVCCLYIHSIRWLSKRPQNTNYIEIRVFRFKDKMVVRLSHHYIGFPLLVTWRLYIETAPSSPHCIGILPRHVPTAVDFSEWIGIRGLWLHLQKLTINTLGARNKWPPYSRRHFEMDLFFQTRMHEFRLIFHWRFFPMVRWPKSLHSFRSWLGAHQAISQYLNQ